MMKSNGKTNFLSSFPEDMFVADEEFVQNYTRRILAGLDIMSKLTVSVGFLCRDCEQILPYTLLRIARLCQNFKSYKVFAFENDSVDKTVEILKKANVRFVSEKINSIKHESVKTESRKIDMAYYRNRLRHLMLQDKSDIYIILDSDLLGGFSYEGIFNSFSYLKDFDVCGSNGILVRKESGKNKFIHYDSWPFREFGNPSELEDKYVNRMTFLRGEPLEQVWSCFGGLAIYKKKFFEDAQYEYNQTSCDHSSLHLQMIENGARIVLNPSQIVLYNRTRYVV